MTSSQHVYPLDSLIRDAVGIVRTAMNLACYFQPYLANEVRAKGDQTPVTAADLAVQAITNEKLGRAFGLPIIGEESSETLTTAGNEQLRERVLDSVRSQYPRATFEEICTWLDYGRTTGKPALYWTLDPIDGTAGFVRGDYFAVVLSLVAGTEIVLSIIGCPFLQRNGAVNRDGTGTILVADRRQKPWAGIIDAGRATRVYPSPTTDLAQLRIVQPKEPSHGNTERVAKIVHALGSNVTVLEVDSAVKYMMVALGWADAYLRFPRHDQLQCRSSIWDGAGGVAAIRAAGGRVTDLRGHDFPLILDNQTMPWVSAIIGTNGHIHEQLLDTICMCTS